MGDRERLEQVIDGGYCTGCGACAALDARIQMAFDDMQRLQAHLPDGTVARGAANGCPFADEVADEDTLATELFSGPNLLQDDRIGVHLATFGGWVTQGDFRERASSGGIGSWLQAELLRKGLVDAVLDVSAVDVEPGKAPLFRFVIARSIEDIQANAKTRYYPVEISEVMTYIRNTPGRFAIIGVPCFAKAARLVARQDPVIAKRLRFVLAIVCGHLKSGAFADLIAWQSGIHPDALTGIDFRTKLEGRPASRYGTTVSGLQKGEPVTETRPMEGLVGANWGHGVFKLKGCEFCDDVLGETADAVVGDAWLPAYDADPKGANIAVVRNPALLDLLQQGHAEGRLHLDNLSADDVAASQAGGLRHRRDGLAFRLWLTDRAGLWRPRKRIAPRRDHLNPHMQRIHRARYELGQYSHAPFQKARQEDRLDIFLEEMRPRIAYYERLMKPSVHRRVLNLLHRKVISLGRRLRITRHADCIETKKRDFP